jgi:anti-sigma regulatory factor (Ser/Thr protein kinase)
MTLTDDVSLLRELRRSLAGWLERHGASPDARDAVVLATHEAAINAIEHGHARETKVTAAMAADGVDVTVINAGGPWPATEARNEERGRGIALIKGLMTETAIHNDGRTTTAVMRLRL